MALEVYYTPHAKETLKAVYNFINGRFGIKPANSFSTKAERVILLIVEQPLMFKASDSDENVRVALITKQTSLFYRVTDTAIYLLFFWDNRQEPL